MATDHYAVLGVTRDASPDEIKRAYRNLARRYHPDANRDDPHAEERFKELSRAYEVLSDPQKRQRYDTFGDERTAAGFTGFGADFSDFFSTFFGGMGGGGASRGPARGADILAEVVLTLEDAFTGTERDVEIESMVECPVCAGSGAAPSPAPAACAR